MAGKCKELQAHNVKMNHITKMIQCGGTLVQTAQQRDLTPEEKESGKLIGKGNEKERKLTDYEMEKGKLLVCTLFNRSEMDNKQKQLLEMHEMRKQLKEEFCNIPLFSYIYPLCVPKKKTSAL